MCENKKYVWYVELDYDSPYYILNVISEDKYFIMACPLDMKIPYIIRKEGYFRMLNMLVTGIGTSCRLTFLKSLRLNLYQN